MKRKITFEKESTFIEKVEIRAGLKGSRDFGKRCAGAYRYGFNGKEKDDELKGIGNSYDFGARMYDSRVGRWFRPDPLQSNFPFESPFAFVSGNPMIYKDPDGNTKYYVLNIFDETTGVTTQIKIVLDEKILKKVQRDIGPKSHAEYVYDWHDVNIVQNVVRKKDGSFIIDASGKETLGEKRTTTAFDWGQTYANIQADVVDFMSQEERPSKWEGGISWYSKTGQGGEVRIGDPVNVKYEEADELISALKTGRGFGKEGKSSPYPTSVDGKHTDRAVEAMRKIFETSKKLAKEVSNIATIYDTGEKVLLKLQRVKSVDPQKYFGNYQAGKVEFKTVDTTVYKTDVKDIVDRESKKTQSKINEAIQQKQKNDAKQN